MLVQTPLDPLPRKDIGDLIIFSVYRYLVSCKEVCFDTSFLLKNYRIYSNTLMLFPQERYSDKSRAKYSPGHRLFKDTIGYVRVRTPL